MNPARKPKRYLLKILKAIVWVTLSVIFLLIVAALVIQIPAVQRRIVSEAVSFLKGEIKTEVRLRHVSLSFPKRVVLEGLYVEDQKKDTLLYVGKLGIDTDLWGLTQKTIELNDVQFDTLVANIKRPKNNEAFNFNFIIDAFAGDTTKTTPKDTTATPWQFAVEDVGLSQTHATFIDHYGGNEIRADIGELEVSMDEFDINKLIFKAGGIKLHDASVDYNLFAIDEKQTEELSDTTKSELVQIGAGDIDLERIIFDFNNYDTRQLLKVNLSRLIADIDEIDLHGQKIAVDDVTLENTFTVFHQMASESTEAGTIEDADTTTSKQWMITVNDIELVDDAFQYYNFNQPSKERGIDFNRLWLSQITIDAEDLKFHGIDDLAAEIQNLSFYDKSGFTVDTFQSDVLLTQNEFELNNLNCNSGNSSLQLDARAEFDSFKKLAESYGNADIDVKIKSSFIGVNDILYFQPDLLDSLPINIPPGLRVKVDASFDGSVNDLNIEHLLVQLLNKTELQVKGKIKGFPDAKNSTLTVELQKLFTTDQDLQLILKDSLIPSSIQLPQWINLTAKVSGSVEAPVIDSKLDSEFGLTSLNAKLNFDSTAAQNYDAFLHVQQFELGKLLKQDTTIGKLDLRADAKGRGFKMKDIDARLGMIVNDFEYNGYQYQDLNVNGTLKEYFFDGKIDLNDENLDVEIKGDLNYQGDVPRYKLTAEVKNADFYALKLSQRQLRLRGTLDVNLATADFKVLNGNINLRKVAVYNGEKLYAVDSLLFASIDQRGESEINIQSDILSGQFKGNMNVFTLPEAFKRHINGYFSLRDTVFDKAVDPQNFDFNLVIKNTDLLTEIIFPDLEPFVPGKIAGEFDSESKHLKLDVNLADIAYAGLSLDSVWLKVRSDSQSFDYTFTLEKVRVDTLRIEELKLSGNIMHDSIYSIVSILDSLQKEKYVLGGVFNSYEDAFQFRFLNRLLILNYEKWKTPMYNTLRFTDRGMIPNNFYISKDDERILLIKKENQDSTLSLVFSDVDLKNITSIVEGVTPLGGIIDGDLTMGVAMKGSFNSELNIKDLKVLEHLWGDLALKLSKTSNTPKTTVDLAINGANVDMKTDGTFGPKNNDTELHLNTTLTKLDLNAIEPLTKAWIRTLKGQLTGNINVDGLVSKPAIDGELRFNNAEFSPAKTGGHFSLKDERLHLTGTGVTLNNFKITDDENNTAIINGRITTSTFRTFELDLTLDTRNFRVMNTTEKDNNLFFGNVRLNAKAQVTGTSDLPRIRFNASVAEGSEFTYIVPENEKTILEQEGIVRFVDRDAVKDPFLKDIKPADTVTSTFKGIDLTANIELTDKATFNIIIDPITGDKLSVKGNSTLTLDIDETGDMQVSGRYEITEGSYNLSFYKLVRRQFTIEKGGTIIWSGDALQPELDIRALYVVETSPIDLVATQVEATGGEDLNIYRTRLPFYVYLILKGDLLSPDIRFQLDMPPDKQNAFSGSIYTKIKDINTRESDLNKQVFALLILKRFISDNPLESEGGSDVASTARTSVSKLLTEQLNRLGDNIKGIQLDFDVKSYEDYSTGTAQGQTELQLGLSKSLLNDRLVVKVSGNLDVEGDQAGNQSSVSDFIGDLAIEYKLTPDGRLRITGFRNSNYDMIDGELVETGAGIIYIKDYDAFRELFRSNAKHD
jgi:translocation and assembly module TamB